MAGRFAVVTLKQAVGLEISASIVLARAGEVTQAEFTFVVVGEDGRPRQITPQTRAIGVAARNGERPDSQ
jgi:acyl-CoA hydrolase